MSDSDPTTTHLRKWLDRMQAGDQSARDELLRAFSVRLERLARKMLRQFSGVRRWEDTDDVLQNATVRLLRALQHVQPKSTREFFALAAEQIRRELLDLARHYYGPLGSGGHQASVAHLDSSDPRPWEPPEAMEEPADFDKWCAFHVAVEQLPPEEREVVSLVFYHGWTQAEVAELLQVAVRTVQRRWQSALLCLRAQINDEML